MKLDEKDGFGTTVLLLAWETLSVVRLSSNLAKKCDNSGESNPNFSPLTNQEYLEDYEIRVACIIHLLVEHHGDVNIENDGRCPLLITSGSAFSDILSLLLQHGARVPASMTAAEKHKRSPAPAEGTTLMGTAA